MDKVKGALGKSSVIAGGAAAAALAAGGALIKHQLAPKKRKVLGVPLPTPKLNGLSPAKSLNMKNVGKQIAKAGERMTDSSKELSKFSDRVERAGKSAQQLGETLK